MSKRQRKADGSIDLRVDLKPDIADILIEIMEDRKFQYYAESVRYCIVETHKKTEFQLEESYWNKIKKYLNYDYVKNKKHIYNTLDFVNKSLENYFDLIENKIESILSFDVRSELNEEELEISMAFLDCQEASFKEQVTSEDVAKKLNRRNVGNITDILESFVYRGILSKIVHKSDFLYHAKSIDRYS
ncbi:MAG: hypothetical protein ACXAD7_09240 [Candidatus Kariarchaeaceae archaeon]|jgi:hypothetical protein